jgi:hypothetical protein
MTTLDLLRTGQLDGRQRLDLSDNLTEFPLDILRLADSLEVLDLSNNHLTQLPDEFRQLTKLKALFLYNNQFEELPAVIADCPNLTILGLRNNRIRHIDDHALSPNWRWLILTSNCLESLPSSIGRLHQLQKLMLTGNQLRSLPPELSQCRQLELLRLSANQLTERPDFLLSLPRLSWLAYAGNPFYQSSLPKISPRSLPTVDWSKLTIQETLGQGTSGIISKAVWHQNPPQTVAVKVFKGNISSDGFPQDELNASIVSGSHPNLVSVLGRIANHPDGRNGLVVELIPPTFRALGGPPNLDTCTRDTFPSDRRFSVDTVLNVATNIASATAHLHSRGLLHGDIYAHNILTNPEGHSLLTDFGAASLYDRADLHLSQSLERIEVRAIGCLLDDLLVRLADPQSSDPVVTQLHDLRDTCMIPQLNDRPMLSELCDRLAAIGDDLSQAS